MGEVWDGGEWYEGEDDRESPLVKIDPPQQGPGSEGVLGVTVSPPYIGLGNAPDEALPSQCRARIQYRAECVVHQQDFDKCECSDINREYVGYASVWVPKGTYTMFVYFTTPEALVPASAYKPLPHPFVQPEDGWVPVDPIIHRDPATPEGMPR